MPDLERRLGLGAQRSAPTASETQARRDARRGLPAEPGPVPLPGRLRSWRPAPGPRRAAQVQGGVHPAGLGGKEGRSAQAR